MADEERLVVALEARIRDFERNMARASQTAGKQFGSIEARAKLSTTRLESSLKSASDRINSSFKNFGAGLLSGIVAGLSVDKLKGLLDGATAITNALKVAGLAGEDLTKVYGTLFESAQRNAAPLESLVTLYSRVSSAQKELGVTGDQVLTLTDNVAKSVRLTGGSAQEASGALLQLSQALGGGKLQAEEYNSLVDGLRPLLQAAAAGMKQAGGSVAELTRLVKNGEVSSRAFFDAINAGSYVLDQKLAGATMTTSQGFVRVGNALLDAARKFDQTTNASKTLGTALGDLATYIQKVNVDNIVAEFQRYIEMADNAIVATNNLAYAIGQALGLGNVGEALVNNRVGAALGLYSGNAVARRMAGDVPETPDRLKDFVARRYGGGQATTTTPKEDRVPAAPPPAPIDITAPQYAVPPSSKAGAGSRAKSQDDFQREIAQTQARIAALRAETEAQAGVNPLVDDYGRAVETARIRQELLTAAQKAGVAITPEVSSKIDALAQSYADASVASRKLAEEQDRTRQSAEDFAGLGKDVLGGFISDLRSGKSAAEALADALDKIADKLLDMALNSLFSTAGGGGIFGAIGSFLGFSQGGVVHLAGGGHVRGPGTSTSDSIPAMLSDGEYVVRAKQATKHRALLEAINNGSLPALASGGTLDGKNVARLHRAGNDNPVQQINLPVSVTVNAQGGDPVQNRDLARQTARETQDAVRAVVQSELRTAMRPGGILRGG